MSQPTPQLAEEHRGLAIWFAKAHWRRAKRARIDWAALVEACERGVADAAAGFDPARGPTFAAYAAGFIRGQIARLHRSVDEKTGERRSRGHSTAIEPKDLEDEWIGYAAEDAVQAGALEPWDLGILRRRVVLKQTQATIAAETGYSIRAVRRLETAAVDRFRRFLDGYVRASGRFIKESELSA